ncbi:MAG TPA: HYR domain-containing protein [Kofleriaceae bacterium]|nr:HYR domain-containing protein [Kofleriaceae bacterium]
MLVSAGVARATDTDADGIDSSVDNCPTTFNPLQDDCNNDGQGDACDPDAGQNDTDGDHVCQGVDNCLTVPNIDQRDVDHNGVGDMCEASWSNRDDDADGIKNSADPCPLEAVATCAMQAITVPWVPANPAIPHSTYSGVSHTVKGIARYLPTTGTNSYMWDFGDGSAATAWTNMVDGANAVVTTYGTRTAYNLGVAHTYTGAVGQTFIATLSVRNSANLSDVKTAIYRVQIKDSSALPAAAPYNLDTNKMDVLIDMAVDRGLWYLHTTMNHATYADSSPGWNQPYGYWTANAGTCTALDAFELHGSKPNKDFATDPYVEDSQRALNYILANSQTIGIANQTAGNPDYNRNGTGVVLTSYAILGSNDETYVAGICGVAVASSGTPTRQALVGAATYVRGRTLKDITQDMAEYFAWGQSEPGNSYRGGWLYQHNSGGADGSTNQWPLLAMAAAEDNMAIKTPAFVRTEAPYFMAYTRHTALDSYNGGWGYTGPSDAYVNHVKTAAGMLFHYFEGDSTSHPEVQAALGFLYRNWALNSYGSGGAWNVGIGNSYAMYGIMKAMRKPQPNILRITEYNYNTNQQTANSFDWYYTPPGQTQEGLATDLVKRQAADGSWSDAIGNNAQSGAFATGWDILILSKGVTTIPPVAAIGNCGYTWNPNQSVTLDGSPSTHPDLNRKIVKWEWDFNYTGGVFDIDASGMYGLKPAGYAATGTYPVALRVTDDNPVALGGPQSSIISCNIIIQPPNNCPHPSAGGPYLASRNVAFNLDATSSFDPDPVDSLTYSWDLNNDGVFGDAVGAQPSATFANYGTFTIAVKVTDAGANGLTAPCAKVAYTTVEVGNHAPVADPGGPYINAPGTFTLNGTHSSDPDGDTFTYGWDLDNNGTFTDSALPQPSFTIPAAAANGTVYTVCLKVTDAFGLASTAKCASVTVRRQNTAPSCPVAQPAVVAQCTTAGVTVTLDGSQSSDADGDPLTYVWTTTCPNASIGTPNQAQTTMRFSSALTPGCTATLTLSDGAATTPCQRPINIVDDVLPTFVNAPGNKTVECNAAAAGSINAWLASATATDACSTPGLSNDFVAVANGCGGATGTAHVTWTATDVAGNHSQTSANLSVVDTTAPSVTCPAPLTVECTDPMTNVLLSPSATDACFGALAPNGPTSANYAIGTTPVTFTSTDSCNNTASCTTSVTVKDTTAPDITCPQNQTIECNADHSATGVVVANASATDRCGAATVTSDKIASGTYALGATTVTQTATDGQANAAACHSTVNVVDTTPPALACPADVTVECNAPGGATDVDAGHAAATEVCTGATVTDPPVGTYALGVNHATHTAVDGAGNASSCSNLVTVRDTTNPTISCPANQTIECNAPGGATDVNVADATSTDACGVPAVSSDKAANGTYALGTTKVTQVSADGAGNTATCDSSVEVVDTTAPTLTCPANLTVECNAPGGATGVDAGHASATDVCSAVTITDAPIGTYALGANAASHSAVDAYGNTTSCSNVVTVVDTKGPVFDAASLATRTVTGSCAADPVSFPLPTATDGCQAATVTCAPLPGNSVGTNTVTCTATDASGNKTTANLTVNVLAPYRVAITSLADDNVADDPATDADVSNLFKTGTNLPHYVRVYNCSGADVTGTAHLRLTLRMTVTLRSGVGAAGDVSIVPESSTTPDAGDVMAYNSGYFKYTLATNLNDYPSGTVNNSTYFNTLMVATENSSPGVWVGREDARLESK